MVTILAIDDHKDDLISLSEIINEALPGSTILTALNGSKGIESAIDHDPDIIILNICRPTMDGIEVCRQLKLDKRVDNIPVLVLAEITNKEGKLKALEAGADGFLTQPVDKAELIAQVKILSKIKNIKPVLHPEKVKVSNELKTEIKILKKEEETLRESDHLHRIVADYTYDWEFLVDHKRRFIYCSPSCERITGYNADQFMAEPDLLNRIVHPDDQIIYLDHIREVHSNFHPGEINFRIIRSDGTIRWIGHVCQPVLDEKGALMAIRGSNRDITEHMLSEEQLVKSEEKYRTIFENVQDVYYESTLDGILLEVSPSIETFTRGKYKREDFIGKTIKDLFINIKERDFLRRTLFEQGSIADFEISVQFNNEFIIPCTVSSKIGLDQFGQPQKIIGSLRDITQRKKAEESLSKSEESYRLMFDNNPQPMFIYDLETLYFVQVNNAAIQHYGYSRGEFYSMTVLDIRPAEDLEKFLLHNRKDNPPYNSTKEWRHQKKNGEIIYVDIVSHALTYNNRPARHILINDVTNRKKAEKSLLKSEEKFRSIFENNTAVKLLINRDNGKIVDANIAAAEYYGWSCQELKEMKIQQINTLSVEETQSTIQQITTNNQHRFEFQHRHKDGSITDVEVFSSNVEIDGKNYLHSIIHDISDRQQAEKALRDQEESYRKLFESNPHPMWVYNLETLRFLAVNTAAKNHYGYSSEEFYRMTIAEIRPEEDISRLMDNVSKVNSGLDKAGIWRHRKKNGQLILVEIVSHTIEWFGMKAEIVLVNDVTDRIMAEESIQKLSLAINQSKEIIFITDKEGIITFINPQFTKIYGYTPEEIVGRQTPRILKSGLISPQMYDRLWSTLLRKNRKKDEYINKCKDGRLIDIEGSADPILDEKGEITGYLGIQRDITERKRAEKEIAHSHDLMQYVIEHDRSAIAIHDRDLRYIYVSQRYLQDYNIKEDIIGRHHYEVFPDLPQKWKEAHQKALAGEVSSAEDDPYLHTDGTIDWTRWECRPWYNANGSVGGIIIYTELISERKQAEVDLITAKEKAEESDQLKSAFLANMSHEIRTPLNSIIGFSELLRDSYFEEEQKREFINMIIKNGENLLSIISDIMDISKIQAGELKIKQKPMLINKFLMDIINEYSMKFQHKQVEFRLISPDTSTEISVLCDPERLFQVFNNLLSNAVKFTSKGYILIRYELTDDFVQFQVKDTGIGIAAENHEKIFDRFRQVESPSNRKYGGNGLGLAISKKLIELMGGNIWLESKQGIGSTFYFTLPLANKQGNSTI